MIELTIPVWDIWSKRELVIDVRERESRGDHARHDVLIGLRREMAFRCVASAVGGTIRRRADDVPDDIRVDVPDHSPLCATILQRIVCGNRAGIDGYKHVDRYLNGEYLNAARIAIGQEIAK